MSHGSLPRPRRSALYIPGSNPRALEKAQTLATDVLILDLEDAVAPSAKEAARAQIIAALKNHDYGQRECVVRVNALDTPWGADDLRAMAHSGAAAVCLPKVESAALVHAAVALLDEAGAPAGMGVWIMAETPRGILAIDSIAAASPRLQTIVLGTSDLAKDLRVPHTPARLGLLASLGRCVLAARAFGLDVLDGVHLDLDDDAGLELACAQGRELGFDGKTLIHPRQLAAANRAFRPAAGELARAESIVAAWSQAQAEGKGVVLVDGKLVEQLHVDEAQRTLALAAALAQRAQ